MKATNSLPAWVIVLGPYRSGTSLVSAMISRLGVDFGAPDELVPADDFNPLGYFERDDINLLNTDLLASAGYGLADPADPQRLLEAANPSALKNWRPPPAIGGCRGLKDPRFCLTLPLWRQYSAIAESDVRLVVVNRSLDDVMRSTMSHPAVVTYVGGDAERAKRMIRHYAECARTNAKESGWPWIEVEYAALLRSPVVEMERLATFLGVDDPIRIRDASRAVGRRSSLWRFRMVRTLRPFLGRIKHDIRKIVGWDN
jgi:hypothetical protein